MKIALALLPVVAAIAVTVAVRILSGRRRYDWIDDARPVESCLMISNFIPEQEAEPFVSPHGVVWRGGPRRSSLRTGANGSIGTKVRA